LNPGSQQPADGTLLFIYAADSGLFNTVADIAHKIFSPQTYSCQLCALTHGHFKVRKAWQEFVAKLPAPCLFLHRDEAQDLPGVEATQLPAVYRRENGQWQLCLGRDVLTRCRDLEQLMAEISDNCLDS
jgi:hypothetical protein